MKLFLKPGSCSLASHIVLEEIGRPYDTETVDLAKKLTASGADFWAINPKGYVPALLLDDGDLLTEGPAILQYLADRKIRPHIHARLPLAEAAAAHALLESRQVMGKLILRP